MITEKILLFILVVHFFADFVLQTHGQAINKHKGKDDLLLHCLTYSLTWLVASIYIFDNFWKMGLFTIITFVLHCATDFITSNFSKDFFDKKDYHNGFVVIGFDQVLHYVQLYLTIKLL